MKPVTRKRYTAEFKAHAVSLVDLGKPVGEVAEDLGIGTSLRYGWVSRDSQPGQIGSAGLRAVGELTYPGTPDIKHASTQEYLIAKLKGAAK